MRLLGRALAALALACAVPASGGAVWEREPDSDWARERPAPPEPEQPKPPPVPEGGFTTPDEIRFRDRLEKGLLDKVCHGLSLPARGDFGVSGLGGVGGGFERRLRQLPDGHEAVIDTAQVRFHVGYSVGVPVADGASLNFWAGASAEGESVVMRPLKGTRACRELGTLADFREIKTVFPFNASRIAAMGLGEVWRLPIRLSWGYAPAAGFTQGAFSVSITVGGYSEGGQAALTLYRMAEDKIRMRFRVEDAEIRAHGGSLTATLPALQVGSLGENILAHAVDRVIARELSQYVHAQLSHFRNAGHGQRIMLEVVLDPSDQAQLEALSDVVRGDLTRVLKLVAERNGLLPARTAEANGRELRDHYAARIGAKDADAFLDTFRNEASGWFMGLPLLTRQSWNSGTGEDRMQRLDSGEGEVRIYHAASGRESGYFYLPFVGAVVKDNASRSAQVLTQVVPEGSAPPAAVYIRQRGFERVSAARVREMAEEFSALAALVGKESGAPAPRTALPVEGLFPDIPVQGAATEAPGQALVPAPVPLYDKGAMSLSILLTPEGLRQVVHADPAAVVRALGNTADAVERAFLSAAQAAGFERRAVWREALRAAEAAGDAVDPFHFARLADRATGLIADLARLRAAPGNDRQAKAFSRLVAGEGESGLEFDGLMAVLIQLADPSRVRADFNIDVKKGEKGVDDLASRYRLNGGIDGESIVSKAGQLRGRFSAPGDLTD